MAYQDSLSLDNSFRSRTAQEEFLLLISSVALKNRWRDLENDRAVKHNMVKALRNIVPIVLENADESSQPCKCL